MKMQLNKHSKIFEVAFFNHGQIMFKRQSWVRFTVNLQMLVCTSLTFTSYI